MVQVVVGGKSRSGRLAESLGQSLGEGLGEFVGSYLANKDLQRVLDDKSLREKPLSERLSALEGAVRPHGERGMKMLQQQMMIEQRREQEKQEKISNKKGEILRKRLANEKVSPEELQMFTPEEELAIAKHKQALEIENLKNQRKPPPGGLSGQPVPPEQISKIEKVISQNPNANATQLGILMGKEGINPAYSNPYLETKRREDEAKPKNILDIHKLSQKATEEINEKEKAAARQIDAVRRSKEALKSGKVHPSSLSNIFRGLGTIGDKIADAVLSKDEASLLASIPAFIEGMKDIFGVRLSDADLRVVQDKLPSISKSVEANEAILDIIDKYANIAKSRGEIAREITKENGGFRPINFEDQIEERLEKRQHPGHVKMRSPSGKIAWIPEDQVQAAIGAKGQILQ